MGLETATSRWIWVSTNKLNVNNKVFDTIAGVLPSVTKERMNRISGTWVAIKMREVPFVESLEIKTNLVILNGKTYEIKSRYKATSNVKRSLDAQRIKKIKKSKPKDSAKESNIIKKEDKKIKEDKYKINGKKIK